MSDSQPQQAGGGGQQPNQQQVPSLLRADDILKLQCLGDDEKQKHRVAMLSLWNMTTTHPAGSPAYIEARTKLTEWSSRFIARERAYRQKMKAQQGQPQLPNAGQGSQAPTQTKQEQAQGANTMPSAGSAQMAPNNQQQAARPAPANLNVPNVDPTIVQHVREFPFALPPGAPPMDSDEGRAQTTKYKNQYLTLLNKSATLTAMIGNLSKQNMERPEQFAQKRQVEMEYAQVKKHIEGFRQQQKAWKEERERSKDGQQQQQQQQGQGQQPQAQTQQPTSQQTPQQQQPTLHQQPQRHPNQPAMPPQSQMKDEPQIKIEGGQMPQPQQPPLFNGMQTNPQQQQQHQLQQNMHPQQQQPHSLPQQAQQQQQQQQQFPRPPPIQQQMAQNQGQQFAPGQQQHLQQQQQQHGRPQINPHQQSNSPHPQSATPNAGPPVPLSHQAAVSAANRSYTDSGPPRTNTPMGPSSGGGGGGQGANFHAPGSREREQLNNPKMPIPRHLNVTAPGPVNMGQARPTMSGPTNGAPGPMGQPVIPRPPPFQLEGEGERVLNKRKLDELVRQVTGGGEEELTPEVEEAVMQLADDFVDNVISTACKLSKLRESPQLDIRDMQLILERNYNIRIPGYASDEVRTVRKIVPATGWVEKMKAVNAAKVMGGKTDF